MTSTMEEETILDVPNDLEDGELSGSDVGDDHYTPLVRPDNFVPHINPASIMSMNIQDDHSDESDQESSSEVDSDSDNVHARTKRPKIKIKRHKKPENTGETAKKNKYDIWCKTVQEDTLADDLISCDVAKTKSYGVESYDHTILYRLNGESLPFGFRENNEASGNFSSQQFKNKRNHRDRGNVKLRLGRRNSYDSDHERGETRNIEELITTADSPNEEVAKDIAEKLQEEKHNLMMRIVDNVGKQKAIDIFKETKRIEEDGGMMIMNGMRRRTPGGVFIFLLKRDEHVTQDMIREIFLEEKQETNRQKKKAQAKHRSQKVEQLKQTLADSVLPAIRTRAEQWAQGAGASTTVQVATEDHDPESSHHVSNPPPSPVTDGRDGSSDVDTNHFNAHRSPENNISDHIHIHTRENNTMPASDASKSLHIPQDPRAALSRSYEEDYIDIGCGDDMDLF